MTVTCPAPNGLQSAFEVDGPVKHRQPGNAQSTESARSDATCCSNVLVPVHAGRLSLMPLYIALLRSPLVSGGGFSGRLHHEGVWQCVGLPRSQCDGVSIVSAMGQRSNAPPEGTWDWP